MDYSNYKIIIENKIIFEYYKGKVNLQDIINFKETIKKDPVYNFSFNTIIDLRDCLLDIDYNDDQLNILFDYLIQNKPQNSKRRVFFITSTPHETALATLYTMDKRQFLISSQTNICSTVGSIPSRFSDDFFTEQILNEILNKLRENPKL